jgi:hypothetical protein
MQWRWSWLVCLGLTALLVLSLGIRFHRLASQSMWIDEVSSLENSRVPMAVMFETSAMLNNSLPTYFLLLRAICPADNTAAEFAARAVSGIAGGLTVPVLTVLVFLWRRNWKTAFAAGILLAINPLHLWYSQEARAYAPMLLLGCAALLGYELGKERETKPVWWCGYIAFAIAAAAFHKTALVFPVICGLRHLRDVLPTKRWASLWPHVPVAAFVLFVLSLESHPPVEFGRPPSLLEIPYTALTFVGGYSFGPSLADIQNVGPLLAVKQNLPQILIIGGVLALLATAFARKWREVFRGPEIWLALLGVGVVAATARLTGFPFNVRYALPGLLGFLAMTGALASAPQYLSRLALASLVGVSLWADVQWFTQAKYRKADYRAVAAWLIKNSREIRTWTAVPDYCTYPLWFYLQSAPSVREGLLRSPESRTATFPPAPDVLILGRRSHVLEPEELVSAYQTNVGPVSVVRSIQGFELYTPERLRPKP